MRPSKSQKMIASDFFIMSRGRDSSGNAVGAASLSPQLRADFTQEMQNILNHVHFWEFLCREKWIPVLSP
ncbi:MAG: hypothetical protein AAGA26_05340, partial [Pseudomonadota bacterium]